VTVSVTGGRGGHAKVGMEYVPGQTCVGAGVRAITISELVVDA
jgi:hypothetical protein